MGYDDRSGSIGERDEVCMGVYVSSSYVSKCGGLLAGLTKDRPLGKY